VLCRFPFLDHFLLFWAEADQQQHNAGGGGQQGGDEHGRMPPFVERKGRAKDRQYPEYAEKNQDDVQYGTLWLDDLHRGLCGADFSAGGCASAHVVPQ